MVSYRDNDNFFGEFSNDDVVREALEDNSFGTTRACSAGHVCERNNIVFEKADSGVDRMVEFCTQPGTLFLIPGRRLNRFFCGLLENPYPRRYRLPSRSCIRRRNSSRSISLAVPASISESRRRISLSHASAASASAGSSRLLTRACASSAQSALDNVRASERSLFSVSVPMSPPDIPYRTMIFRLSAPNKPISRRQTAARLMGTARHQVSTLQGALDETSYTNSSCTDCHRSVRPYTAGMQAVFALDYSSIGLILGYVFRRVLGDIPLALVGPELEIRRQHLSMLARMPVGRGRDLHGAADAAAGPPGDGGPGGLSVDHPFRQGPGLDGERSGCDRPRRRNGPFPPPRGGQGGGQRRSRPRQAPSGTARIAASTLPSSRGRRVGEEGLSVVSHFYDAQ